MHILPSVSVIQEAIKRFPFLRSCQAFSMAGVFVLTLSPTAGLTNGEMSVAAAETDTPGSRPETSLCDWQRDYAFFVRGEKNDSSGRVEVVPCDAKPLVETGSVTATSAENSPQSEARATLEDELRSMVAGHPIEAMVPTIAEYDREIAGLIVGIAKKESNWGKRVPRTDNGDDCFNYWGFKGAGARGMAMGHGCFGEPAEAVHAIGNRLQELVALRQTSEPARLTVWKCGSSCAGHSDESVAKWISDVDLYYRKIARQ